MKNEDITVIHNDMDESHKNNIERKMLDRKIYILLFYLYNFKRQN